MIAGRLILLEFSFYLFRLEQHPESFPVNTLVPIEVTPLAKNDVSTSSVISEMDNTPY